MAHGNKGDRTVRADWALFGGHGRLPHRLLRYPCGGSRPDQRAGGTSVERAYLRRIARFYWKILLPKSWVKIVKGKIDYQRVFMALNFQFRSLQMEAATV